MISEPKKKPKNFLNVNVGTNFWSPKDFMKIWVTKYIKVI